MNRPFIRFSAFFWGIGLCLGLILAPSLTAKEVFRAKLMTSGGPAQQKLMTVKITIEDYTTADEVRKLQRVLIDSGSDEFMRAFRKSKKGTLNFIGVRGLNVRINTAQSFPNEEGRKIWIFTERQSWGGTDRATILRQHFFMAIELDLDSEGIGTGRFYPGATFRLKSSGIVELDSFLPPEQILGVRKVG